MIKITPASSAIGNAALSAKPELDLGGWPRWMRQVLALPPEMKTPTSPGVEPALARIDPASGRVLSRVLPRP